MKEDMLHSGFWSFIHNISLSLFVFPSTLNIVLFVLLLLLREGHEAQLTFKFLSRQFLPLISVCVRVRRHLYIHRFLVLVLHLSKLNACHIMKKI